MFDTAILNLPWSIQLALASGYAAYIIAYSGIRAHHKSVDVAFIALVFSALATACLFIASAWFVPLAAELMAFAATLVGGVVWRKWLRGLPRKLMRHFNFSWSDDDPSAWATMISDARCPVSQIGVQLDDGTWLQCVNTEQFEDAPFGPCRLGDNGDVAFYLTHEESPGKPERELKSVRDPHWGDRITYVPAGRIRRMTIRHKRPPSRPLRAEGEGPRP